MQQIKPVLKPELSGLKHLSSGKVREMYDLGKDLLIVASDRISAFDVIMPQGIPYKGHVLTGVSQFWFDHLRDVHPAHVITMDVDQMPDEVRKHSDILRGRTMLVKKAKPLLVECVIRGYLIGSGWKDYCNTGAVCGNKLPAGLPQASKLPELIFTPATKAESGHDENITQDQMADIVGKETTELLREVSMKLYSRAAEHAEKCGVILADTKFEFGETPDGIILIDEVLTPDSSRYWPKSEYKTGISPPSFDKQFLRDYLESITWDKKPPAPQLPDEIVNKTSEKYLEAFRLITGKDMPA
jgi:phosphoribosylaminoimidazole-succinocarboxamide synthase